MTGQNLAREMGVHPQLISKWLNRVAVPNGELTLKMLEWVTGRTTEATINAVTLSPGEKAVIRTTKADEKLVEQARVSFASNNGVALSASLPIDTIASILKGRKSSAKENGFELGDLLLELRDPKGGVRFDGIMAASGLSLATLRIYENTAKSVPLEHRRDWMRFSVARELARLSKGKQKELIREIEAKIVRRGMIPTVRDIRGMSRMVRPTRKQGHGEGGARI